MNKPVIIEQYADNGDFSHYELIDKDNGQVLWSSASNYDIETTVLELKRSKDEIKRLLSLVNTMEKEKKLFGSKTSLMVCPHCNKSLYDGKINEEGVYSLYAIMYNGKTAINRYNKTPMIERKFYTEKEAVLELKNEARNYLDMFGNSSMKCTIFKEKRKIQSFWVKLNGM